MALQNILLPPSYSDLDRSHKAGFLHYSLLALIAAFMIFGIINLGQDARSLGITLILFSLLSLVAMLLNKQKKYNLSASILLLIVYIGIFFNLIDGAALHDPGVAALPIFIMISTFLFDKSLTPLLTGFSIISVIGMYIFWSNDMLPLNQDPTINRVVVLSVLQLTTGFIARLIYSAYSNMYLALEASEKRHRIFFFDSPASNWIMEVHPPMPLALPIDEQIEWLLLKSMMIEVNDDYTHHYDGPDFSSIGQNILEIYGGDAQIGRVMIRNFIEGGYQLNMLETEERNHLGEVIWSRISASSIIEDDHLVHIWGSNQNLTDLKRTEIALRESNLRNKLILESLPMAFYRAHASGDLSAIWVSDQIDQISGFSPEIMTTPGFWSSRIHPDDKEKAINGVLRQSKKGSIMREYRWSRSDGEYVWIMDNSVILYDDTNQQTELIGTWTDITEIKLAEETLRDSEERYRTIFEHAAEGISIHVGEIFIDVNQAWEEMFGWKKKDVIGRTPFDFSPPIQPDGRDTKEKGLELLEKARTGEEQQFDWRHTRADGTEFDAEIFMTIISLSGEEVMISFIRDLTERNRAEAAAQEERHRLARELHDAVSQTIFSASMIAQTLDRSWDKNPALVRENLKELDVLTQGALAEMRTLLLELRPGTLELISMPDLLGQLANGFAGRTKTKIQLDISAEESLPAIVRRVFFRLAQESLNNIIKHARAKKVNIQYQSLSDQAQLIIEDDGLGFDPENVGPGHHGIEIMKERAEGIGAEFEIDSQLDKGTIVKISWQPRERFK